MKLWQKATLLFIVVILLAVFSISLIYVQKSNAMNEQMTLKITKNEAEMIMVSVHKRLDDFSDYYNRYTPMNVGLYMSPYGAYYEGQGVYIQLSQGLEVLFTSFSEPLMPLKPDEHTSWCAQGQRYLAYQIAMQLSDGQAFELMIIRDIQYLGDYQEELMRFSTWAASLCALMIGLISFVLFRHLTKPFQALEAGARRIASGEYTERVMIDTKDEIGMFANTFNIMADSVERQIREMDELVADRQQFIDHVAHEIRTPITAMIGFSEVMLHAKATETDKQRAAEYIADQSTRLKLLSEKLLSLSRLKYDTMELGSVHMLSVINAAEKTLRTPLRTKNLRLIKHVPDIAVSGDAVLLETLFQNLIENAIHASHEGQDIEICADEQNGVLTVSVIDHGIGMRPEDLDRITEPFVQVDAARSRQHGGVGIGLALCNRICALHHTTPHISSQLGEGTSITIDLRMHGSL